jgi:phosphatidylserine decarboxylase
MFTRYGYSTIATVVLLAFILIVGGLFSSTQWLKIALWVLAALILVLTLQFFRDPERTTPTDKNILISPADGKVIIIKEVDEPNFIKGKATQISIFMSPLNVHVNRIPVSGKVAFLQYVQGKFLRAFEDKASTENERSEIGIESAYGKVLFTQVAGYVARRIVYELKPGDSVTIGKRFGMIKFGSRVDVLVPQGWTPNVKLGEKVTAGETILYTYTAGGLK